MQIGTQVDIYKYINRQVDSQVDLYIKRYTLIWIHNDKMEKQINRQKEIKTDR